VNAQDIRELMEEVNGEALNMDGFEEAVMGIVERFGMNPVFLYDWQKCISILIAGGCEDAEEAEEYLHFNCLGAWVGEGTPAFGEMNVNVNT
jgi:hypothetical protein